MRLVCELLSPEGDGCIPMELFLEVYEYLCKVDGTVSARTSQAVRDFLAPLAYVLYSHSHFNKAVVDRRLRPRCCHPVSYFKRPKSSPVRPLACNRYCSAQLIAKPKAACAARLQLGGDVEQPWLISKHDVIHKTGSTQHITPPPEEDRATALGNVHKKIGEDRTCNSEDMIADRRTHILL